MTRPPDRRKHPILTFDRAMLIGAFTVGSFVAAIEFKNADLVTKVEAIERRITSTEARLAAHDVTDAETRTEFRWIRENLGKLADSTAKFVNVVRDQSPAIRAATPTKNESPQ